MTNKIINESYLSKEQQYHQYETHDKILDLRRQSSIVAAKQLRSQDEKQGIPYKQEEHDLILKFPAIILAGLLNLMLAIPFGVSYFPIEWGGDDHEFPIAGKESLGIRMFMFSTFVSQIIFTFTSSFPNAIGMQMVENVPFCHTLAYICISEQGYTLSSLSTLFFLYGLSSILVGIVFYILGYYELGNIVYFFPSHVLIGCIGGIGIFVMKVGIEVSMNMEFRLDSFANVFEEKLHLIGVVLGFEAGLRVLTFVCGRVVKDKKSNKLALLAPLYYCSITPIFYILLFGLGTSLQRANELGFFFPPLDENTSTSSIWNKDLFDIWTVIDPTTISWTTVGKSIPTMISLIAFSLIHVPINIPAFSVSSGIEANMNTELKAHGYSNTIAGIFGGLQNYLCYSNSVLYYKTGGGGKVASLIVAFVTGALFIYGPRIASFIPRCMAGTLLLHVGIDLFKEGVYDSYGKFDTFEYISVWLITIIMSFLGMSAAIITGVITALMTYVIQTIHYQNPIRGSMLASSLRSSLKNRPMEANAILEDRKKGRRRVYVIQLQGHIFFGNAVQLTENIQDLIKGKMRCGDIPWIAIIDFSLVVGIDSSAAQTICKMRNIIHTKYGIKLIIFVTGSTAGFPCMYDLSSSLVQSSDEHGANDAHSMDLELAQRLDTNGGTINETTMLLKNGANMKLDDMLMEEEEISIAAYPHNPRKSTSLSSFNTFTELPTQLFPDDIVCESLDRALIFAEDALLALVNPDLVTDPQSTFNIDFKEERDVAFQLFKRQCGGEDLHNVQIFDLLEREVWMKDQIIWRENDKSTCLKLVVCGELISTIDNDPDASEGIHVGAIFGELGLVSNSDRLTTVKCVVDNTILYSLSKEKWDAMVREDPKLARFIDLIAVRYLVHRVQHVSNRIFETRCLPI